MGRIGLSGSRKQGAGITPLAPCITAARTPITARPTGWLRARIGPMTICENQWAFWRRRKFLSGRKRNARLLILPTCKKHGGGKSGILFIFMRWTAPLIAGYLESCSEMTDTVKKYVQEGKLEIGSWFTLPNCAPIPGESVVRDNKQLYCSINLTACTMGVVPVQFRFEKTGMWMLFCQRLMQRPMNMLQRCRSPWKRVHL